MFSRINKSKRIAIVTLVILVLFLAGACGPILPGQGRNETATSAPTFTPVPPTATPTSTPEVAYVTVTPSPPPTQPPLPIFTPDTIQLERWQEYETELAKVLLYGYGPDASKTALCEWDILGRSGQEVYVWAYCVVQGGAGGNRPAVIYLEADGSIQKVTSPAINNATWDSQIEAMFPEDVREKLDLYYFNVCVYCGRPEELRLHLNYRETHSKEPPLIVLSATSITTPAP